MNKSELRLLRRKVAAAEKRIYNIGGKENGVIR